MSCSISEDEHLDIVRRKTAYLFGGCARIGGILGKASPEQERALEQYGISLGTSFQLIDDLLDFAGDESALGKPVGGDLREGKVTLPVIRLLQRADTETAEMIHDVACERSVTPERWRLICRLLHETGAVDYAMDKAQEQAALAKKQLYLFPSPMPATP